MAYENHIEKLVAQVKKGVADAGNILSQRNPDLADRWNNYPGDRRIVAAVFVAPFLQRRSSGSVSLPKDAQAVWGAAVDYVQTKELCPDSFINE